MTKTQKILLAIIIVSFGARLMLNQQADPTYDDLAFALRITSIVGMVVFLYLRYKKSKS